MGLTNVFDPIRLSYWAKQHPTAARWLIAFNRIVLGFLLFYGGAWMADVSFPYAKAAFIASAATFLAGYFLYPRRRPGEPKREKFLLQKLCDSLLIVSSCAFWLGAGNYMVQWHPTLTPVAPPVEVLQSAIAKDKNVIQFPSHPHHGEFLKKAKQKRDGIFKKAKAWKQQFFQKLKSRVKSKLAIIKSAFRKLDGGTIALLILASVAIITVLGYATAVISCNLSCNGQEGAATVVGILGCFLSIGLVAWMWAAAVKKSKQKEFFKKQQPQPPPPIEPSSLPPTSVQIDHPDIRICFESGSRLDVEDVTIRRGNEILLENLLLGAEPQCINLSLKPGEPNTISVSGGNVSVKMVIEDGDLKKSLSLQVADGNALKIDLILKRK